MFLQVLAATFVRLEYLKGIHSNGVTSIFWPLQFICDLITLYSWIQNLKVNNYSEQMTNNSSHVNVYFPIKLGIFCLEKNEIN